jgi:hypothetical protein
VGTGFRKRSCSNKTLERDSDSTKNHSAPEHDPEKWEPVFDSDHAQAKIPGRHPIASNDGVERRDLKFTI